MPLSKRITAVIILILLILTGYLLFDHYGRNHSIAYIENDRVFNDFHMTKEMKAKGERQLMYENKIADSLISLYNREPGEEKKEILMQKIAFVKEEITNYSENYPSQESDKIWTRIKEYSQEYSKQRGFKMLLGGTQDMNILYGDESVNVTQEFIDFINKKYEGIR